MHDTLSRPKQVIRTVLHLSPAVTTAALMTAQAHHMPLGLWLEDLVVQGCGADVETQTQRRLAFLMVSELFAHVASNCPGALTGRWKLLHERCLLESELWRFPAVTVAEVEAGADCQPFLDVSRLRERWPALVANVWLNA